MRFLQIFILVVFLIVFSASIGYSFDKNENTLNVADITVQAFDRSTNKLFSILELPNPYGLDLDLLVSVKVDGKTDPRPQEVTLSVDAQGYTTAATGYSLPWHESQTRAVSMVLEKGISYVPFIVEYQCYPNVFFTASIGKSSKSKRVALLCAE
jgi:hypothetical protein